MAATVGGANNSLVGPLVSTLGESAGKPSNGAAEKKPDNARAGQAAVVSGTPKQKRGFNMLRLRYAIRGNIASKVSEV